MEEKLNLVHTDQPGYMRDEKTGAIHNLNDGDYQRILVKRKEAKKEKEMCDRMKFLEGELGEIKQLLSFLARKDNDEHTSS